MAKNARRRLAMFIGLFSIIFLLSQCTIINQVNQRSREKRQKELDYLYKNYELAFMRTPELARNLLKFFQKNTKPLVFFFSFRHN